MKEIEKIAGRIEAKVEKLEADRERVATQIRVKRAQVAQLETALDKLRSFQKSVKK